MNIILILTKRSRSEDAFKSISCAVDWMRVLVSKFTVPNITRMEGAIDHPRGKRHIIFRQPDVGTRSDILAI